MPQRIADVMVQLNGAPHKATNPTLYQEMLQ